MNVSEIKLNSFEDFLKIFYMVSSIKLCPNIFIFRGQSEDYPLVPSVFRKINEDMIRTYSRFVPNNTDMSKEIVYRYAEDNILMHFYIYANKNGLHLPKTSRYSNCSFHQFDAKRLVWHTGLNQWLPNDIVEVAALAQHYGLPTRLLDWTYDVNVALYFASFNSLRKALSNNNSFKSEYIVVWSLKLMEIEQQKGLNNIKDFPLEFVVPDYYGNPNLNAQKGILTYWKEPKLPKEDMFNVVANKKPLEQLVNDYDGSKIPKDFMMKYLIPSKESLKIATYLYNIGYNAARLFPGYEGISLSMEEEALINKAQENFHNE